MGVALLARLLVPALIGWAPCGVAIAVGRAVTLLRKALIAHAVVAPAIFAVGPYTYFRGPHDTTPLQTAVVHVALVIVLELAVVATFVEKSYAMFTGLLGTWIPFALIFGATYLVGLSVAR